MEPNELVGITLEVEFNYKSSKQKQLLHQLLWSKTQLNKLFEDMISLMSEDFFKREMEKLNVPKSKYKINVDPRIIHDTGIDELLDWVSIDIDIITTSTYYDKTFDHMESYIYEDLLIDVFKKNIISYFLKVNFEETLSINIEITEIGGN